ncbi:small, acid-soluble spore protein tlp [Psychrobacillus sp. BM2]|uniref:small, acid-soluble spore protein tlp n=1 Tax=Psychrobacillus sp. BM2 TaxID=3400421 RepID=UPI003B021A42
MTIHGPGPNDTAKNEERLKKTIRNKEAAEMAMEFAEGEELAAIQKKNERREEHIDGLRAEILAEAKSRINGYS